MTAESGAAGSCHMARTGDTAASCCSAAETGLSSLISYHSYNKLPTAPQASPRDEWVTGSRATTRRLLELVVRGDAGETGNTVNTVRGEQPSLAQLHSATNHHIYNFAGPARQPHHTQPMREECVYDNHNHKWCRHSSWSWSELWLTRDNRWDITTPSSVNLNTVTQKWNLSFISLTSI